MKARLRCVCRGIGRVYFLFEIKGADKNQQIKATCDLSKTRPAICQEVEFGAVDNHRDFVVVAPLSPHAITITLAHAKQSDHGSGAIIYKRTFSPFFIKWASRFNYRFNTETTSAIRDCEKDGALSQDDINIVMAIPTGSSTIYRCVATMPNCKINDVRIRALDENFVDSGVAPTLMGTYEIPKGLYSPVSKLSLTFSMELPNQGKDYSIVLYRNDKLTAFETITKLRLRSLIQDYEKEVQNASTNPNYGKWLDVTMPHKSELKAQSMIAFEYTPLISIVAPLQGTTPAQLAEMLNSITSQSYSNWELILVGSEASRGTSGHVAQELLATKHRVKFLNPKEYPAGKIDLEDILRECQGEYIGFMDAGDVLAPNALYEYVLELNEDEGIDAFYSDSDQIDPDGRRLNPYFKPDLSAFLLRETNYMRNFSVVRESLLSGNGINATPFSAPFWHELLLRCIEQTDRIHHCPKILYSERVALASEAAVTFDAKAHPSSSIEAVRNHLDRVGIDADVQDGNVPGLVNTLYKVKGNPKVSIIIPTKDNKDILNKCVESIIDRSTYKNYEIVIVENNSDDPATFENYEALRLLDHRINVMTWPQEFNYSKINNFAVDNSSGEYLVFLNNDTEVISENWIELLLGTCQQKDVGAVGAKLLYPDGTIQHGGVVIQGRGCDHLNFNLPCNAPGYFNTALTTREVSAVTAACLMCSRQVFEEVKGFDPAYQVAFNDVDLCLKIRAAGYKVIFNSHCLLYHYESISRGPDNTGEKALRFRKELSLLMHRWSDYYVLGDPYSNANLETWNYYFDLPEEKNFRRIG